MDRLPLYNIAHQETGETRCDLSASQVETYLGKNHPELFSVVEVCGDDLGERLNGAEWLAQRHDENTQ